MATLQKIFENIQRLAGIVGVVFLVAFLFTCFISGLLLFMPIFVVIALSLLMATQIRAAYLRARAVAGSYFAHELSSLSKIWAMHRRHIIHYRKNNAQHRNAGFTV